MLGIGPEWTYLKQNGKTSNSMRVATGAATVAGRAPVPDDRDL
jgi:hypothetical protein